MIIAKKSARWLILLAATSAVLAGSAQALACQYAAGTSDVALMNTFPIPTFYSAKSFVMRQAQDFYIAQFSWTGHGAEAWDDTQFEYTKHWMSSYLLLNGSDFEHRAKGVDSTGQQLDFLLDRGFHTAADYYTMAKALATNGERLSSTNCGPRSNSQCYGPPWHSEFVSLLGGRNPDLLGQYVWGDTVSPAAILFWPLALFPDHTETVTTFCGLYDVSQSVTVTGGNGPPFDIYIPNSQNIDGSPSTRASTLVHEGMHAHYRDVSAADHVDCSTGAPDANNGACDHFYPHPKSDYAGGDLNHADGNTHKIPSYEIELEYLCDLTDEGKDWVPLSVISDAQAAASSLQRTAFVDGSGRPTVVPYDCGVPSPMMTIPGTACKVSACTSNAQCGQGGLCDEGCCVVIK